MGEPFLQRKDLSDSRVLTRCLNNYEGWIRDQVLKGKLDLRELSGARLYCSCRAMDGVERCHAQVLIRLFVVLISQPSAVRTEWGDCAESVHVAAEGRTVRLTQQAVSEFMFGQRVAFVEIFCGAMETTLGVKALGLCAPDGIDKLYPVGGRPWDLRYPADQDRARSCWTI